MIYGEFINGNFTRSQEKSYFLESIGICNFGSCRYRVYSNYFLKRKGIKNYGKRKNHKQFGQSCKKL